MKGHVTERSPGTWAIVLDVYDDSGKRRRKWHTFHTTSKRKAEEECARLIAEMRGGIYIEPNKTTLAVFFDRWLEHVEPTVSPGTHERYSWLAKKNIAPLIGDVLLSKLKTERIDRAWTQALQSGRMDGKGGLSPRTVHHMPGAYQGAQSGGDVGSPAEEPCPRVESAQGRAQEDARL
jgi:hypothetical protein